MKFRTAAFSAATLVLLSTLGLAGPASAATSATDDNGAAGQACVQAATDLTSSGGTGDFACLITMSSEEAANLAPPSNARADSVGCYNSTPVRTIWAPSSSDIVYGVIYGQANDPTNGSWSNCIDLTFTIGLQTDKHIFGLSAFSVLRNYNVDLSGGITLEQMEGLLPSRTVDSTGYSNLSGDGFNFTGSMGGTHNGTYIFKLGNMKIQDYERAHTFNLNLDLSTYRFLCTPGDSCRYPDGKEAPVFG